MAEHSRRVSTGARAPINAAVAAKRASRAEGAEAERLRSAAAGTRAPRVRRGAADDTRRRRVTLVLAATVGVLLAAGVMYAVGGAALRALTYDGARDEPAAEAAGPVNGAVTVERVEDGPSLVYGTRVYSCAAYEDGVYMTSASAAGGEAAQLFRVEGSLVGFACYEGTLYVVSNEDGGYLIQSYVSGYGSEPTTVATGQGTVERVELDGTRLLLFDDAGRDYTFDLG